MWFKKKKTLNKKVNEERVRKALSGEDGFGMNLDPCYDPILENKRVGSPVRKTEKKINEVQALVSMIRVPATIMEVHCGESYGVFESDDASPSDYFIELGIYSISISNLNPSVKDTAKVLFKNEADFIKGKQLLEEAREMKVLVILTAAVMWPSDTGIHLHDCEVEITKMTEEEMLSTFDSENSTQSAVSVEVTKHD